MRSIHFDEANTFFNKPETMTDEECYSVSAYLGEVEGRKFINTCWMPNKEDIEAILAGRPIVLQINGGIMPPVALFTYDENGNSND